MKIHRSQEFGITTLELNGSEMDVQLRILSKSGQRERRVLLRSFLKQVKPWLEHFDDPGISNHLNGQMRPLSKSLMGAEVGHPGFEIRARRLKLGLSQENFSKLIGVGRAHLSDIERGLYQPSHRTLAKIEEVLASAM